MEQNHGKANVACVTHSRDMLKKTISMHQNKNRQVKTHLMIKNYRLSRSGEGGQEEDRTGA